MMFSPLHVHSGACGAYLLGLLYLRELLLVGVQHSAVKFLLELLRAGEYPDRPPQTGDAGVSGAAAHRGGVAGEQEQGYGLYSGPAAPGVGGHGGIPVAHGVAVQIAGVVRLPGDVLDIDPDKTASDGGFQFNWAYILVPLGAVDRRCCPSARRCPAGSWSCRSHPRSWGCTGCPGCPGWDNGIPRSDFEQNGIHYTLTDLLKQEMPEYQERQHTEEVSLESKNKDMASILALLPQHGRCQQHHCQQQKYGSFHDVFSFTYS